MILIYIQSCIETKFLTETKMSTFKTLINFYLLLVDCDGKRNLCLLEVLFIFCSYSPLNTLNRKTADP